MSRVQVLLVMMLLSVWAAACAPAPAQPASTATPAAPPPTATIPAPPVIGEAHVESVEVVLLESSPVQAQAIVRGSLPDACTELGEITPVYEAGVFQITLKTTRPAEAVCAQVLAPFETSVTLPVDGLPAAPYTVSANGVRARFALPGAPAADLGAFVEALVRSLDAHDYDTLRGLMDERLMIGLYRSEGAELDVDDALAQLRETFLASDGPVTAPDDADVSALLDGADPLAFFGPDLPVEAAQFVAGLGPDGQDEGIVFVVRRADGSLYWHGLLVAPGGFSDDDSGAIPSTTIIQDYETDPAAADARYKDQTLLIRGRITNLNDVFGTMALMLRDSETEIGLQCYLTDNADAAKVKVGDEVVVRGRVRGGELGFFMVVDECAVVEVK